MAPMDPPMEEDSTAVEVQVWVEGSEDLTTTLRVADSELPAAPQRFVIARLV